MFDGLLTLSFIVPIYFAAFAILRLEKHWHRTAETVFTSATLLALVLLVLWVWNNPDGLRSGIAFTLAIAVIVMNIWFVRKVETHIDSERPRVRAGNDNRLPTESQSPVVSEPDRQAQEAAPQEEQASAPVKPMYDRFLNHPASLGLPEKTYSFYAGPEDAPSSRPIEVKARLRYDSTWSAAIVGIYVNAESEVHTGNGCVAAIRNYNQIAADLLKDARDRNVFFDRTVGLLEIYNEVPLGEGTVNRIGRVNPSGLNIEFIGSVPFPRG